MSILLLLQLNEELFHVKQVLRVEKFIYVKKNISFEVNIVN